MTFLELPGTSIPPSRSIWRRACSAAGVPYVHPHLLRSMLVRFAEQLGLPVEAFVALSQSLGHDSPLTTIKSYGVVAPDRQLALIRGFVKTEPTTGDFEERVNAEVTRRLLAAAALGRSIPSAPPAVAERSSATPVGSGDADDDGSAGAIPAQGSSK